MRRLAQTAAGAQGKALDYSSIAKVILASKPPSAAALPMLFKFFMSCGGGNTQWLLRETESFVMSHGRPGKNLGETVWDLLSMELKGYTRQLVLWRHALLRALYMFDSKVITQNDIRRSLSNRAMVLQITEWEKCMATFSPVSPPPSGSAAAASGTSTTAPDVATKVNLCQIAGVLSILQSLAFDYSVSHLLMLRWNGVNVILGFGCKWCQQIEEEIKDGRD